MTANASRAKDQSVETLRGIAIALVVGYHLIVDPSVGGARGFYEYLSYLLENVRMPIFTVISGYLYAAHPAVREALAGFYAGKARRILLPMASVAGAQYVASALLPGVNNPEQLSGVWRVLFFGYGHFWFLQAIASIFLIVGFCDSRGLLGTPRGWAIGVAIAVALLLGNPADLVGDYFSLGGTTFLGPYFMLGLGIRRFPGLLSNRTIGTLSAVVAIGLMLWMHAGWTGAEMDSSKRTVLGLATGFSSCLALFHFRLTLAPIAFVGSFAYSIYLFQGFGSSIGGRLFGGALSLESHTYFAAVLLFTLLFGIVVEVVVKRIPYLRTLVLGLRAPRATP